MRAFIIWTSIITFIICLLIARYARGETASWYSEETTKAEGHSLIMANGEVLDDNKNTCASWDHSFGTILLITNKDNLQRVSVEVTDRGPSRRLHRMGRTIDLSKAAFSTIADLKQGVIKVKIEVLNE